MFAIPPTAIGRMIAGKTYTDTQHFINANRHEKKSPRKSYYVHMLKDAKRYMPVLKECKYFDSIWEIKTILPQSEVDDSRPILFRRDEKLVNVISVMGGKIDNIFDIRDKLTVLLNTEWS